MAANVVCKLQQTMCIVVLAAVIVAGVQCSNSNHGADERTAASHVHEDGTATPRLKPQSRISMNKNGYGARVQIREDLHGRKHAHAMAICDCNGQGPWRPLFKASQILRTEFPEHESFHEEVDSHYQNLVTEQVDNQLRSALSAPSSSSSSSSSSAENVGSGSDHGGGSFGGGGGGNGFGTTGFNGGGLPKKLNHMIHLHLIPHIYVPIVHAAGYSEAKNYQASEEDAPPPPPLPPLPRSPVYQHTAVNSSPESFQSGGAISGAGGDSGGDATGGVSGGGGGSSGPAASTSSGPADGPTAAAPSTAAGGETDHGGFNGHSGETTYYTITEDGVQHVHHDVTEHQGNAIDGHGHEYEAPPSSQSAAEEPHQYQVHEIDDLSKDYSSKKHVTASSSSSSGGGGGSGGGAPSSSASSGGKTHQHKPRNVVVSGQGGGKAGRAKHARKLSSRQDLKNLLVMRPPPVGQTQTWRYVYHHHHPAVATARHHQFFKRMPPPPMVPVIKARTVPLILHIRQRSDD